jgi:hypothetical protein
MPNWKKVIVSGSDAVLKSITATGGLIVTGSARITGSLGVTGSLDLVYSGIGGGIGVTGHFPRLRLINSGSGALGSGGSISTQDNNFATKAADAEVFRLGAVDVNSSTVGAIVFKKASSGTTNISFSNSGTEGAFYISGSGNIGIGKTTPGAKLDVSGSAIISGSLTVTAGITGSLLGTASYATQALSASYATQALSASYAPGGATFPYTGSAIISGSLGVTGSLIVNENATIRSLDTSNRTLLDTSNKTSIDWGSRYSADSGELVTIDWGNKTLYGAAEITSIDWGTKYLADSSGNPTLEWDAAHYGYAIKSSYYYRSTIGLTEQQGFIDEPQANTSAVNYAGEVIQATLDVSVVDFDLVYLYTDGIWYQNTQANQNSTKLLGICLDKTVGTVLLEGTLTVQSTAGIYLDSPVVQGINHGLPIYIRDGSGTQMSTTAPANSGEVVRVLGHAYQQSSTYSDYWIMKFRPSNDWITI